MTEATFKSLNWGTMQDSKYSPFQKRACIAPSSNLSHLSNGGSTSSIKPSDMTPVQQNKNTGNPDPVKAPSGLAASKYSSVGTGTKPNTIAPSKENLRSTSSSSNTNKNVKLEQSNENIPQSQTIKLDSQHARPTLSKPKSTANFGMFIKPDPKLGVFATGHERVQRQQGHGSQHKPKAGAVHGEPSEQKLVAQMSRMNIRDIPTASNARTQVPIRGEDSASSKTAEQHAKQVEDMLERARARDQSKRPGHATLPARRKPNPSAPVKVSTLAKPSGASQHDKRYDNLQSTPIIQEQHVKLQRPAEIDVAGPIQQKPAEKKTMADFMKKYSQPSAGEAAGDTDPQHKVWFDSWAKPERRSRPSSDVRRVVISDLPPFSAARDVAAVVWGGEIEEIKFNEGNRTATALFINARACRRYYEDTANGIEYKDVIVHVDLAKEVEPLVGQAKWRAEMGYTRCVEAVGYQNDLLPGAFKKIAKEIGQLEANTVFVGAHHAQWRFCSIDSANKFRMWLQNSKDFKMAHISFYADPCAQSDNVHTT